MYLNNNNNNNNNKNKKKKNKKREEKTKTIYNILCIHKQIFANVLNTVDMHSYE